MSANQLKILIVEDNAVDRAIWKRYLSQPDAGFECSEVDSGEAGLTQYAEFQPDCVLLDFNLPDITGIEFMRRLTDGKPRCAVVVATAYGNEDLAVRSMKTGATDYLVKGAVTAEILKHALEGAVEKVRLQNEVERHRLELERRNHELEESHRQLSASLESELRARLAAEESEARYRRLTEAIPHVVWTGTAPWVFRYVNARWQKVTGAPASYAMGDGWLAYVHEEDRARIAQAWLESSGSLQPFETEFRLKSANGGWRWQSIRGMPFSDGGSSRWYGTLTDIEERTRAEQLLNQKQKVESIGVLAAGVAHDFNNLLVGVIGGISMALEVLPDHQAAREFLDGALQSSERVAALTRQLLAYAGKTQFTLTRTTLTEVAESTCQLIRPTISRNVRLTVESRPDPPEIDADSSQIQQIVMNLVLNAAEAIGDAKPGVVSVRTGAEDLEEPLLGHCGREAPPGSYAVLEVTDTGCGMAETTLAKIFDPFFTTKFTGRGLGLAAVNGIVHGHRGMIQVESQPGAGTTFRVWIPACRQRSEPVTEAEPSRTARQNGECILFVDDDDAVCAIAQKALDRAGYRVRLARDGATAVKMAAERGPEIKAVILDLSMPGLSGEETLSRMREAGLACPVIVSSGHGELDIRRRLGSQPVAGFLHKPYTARQLVQAVAERCAGAAAG